MIETGAPSTEGKLACCPRCARLTGGSHDRTDDPVQHGEKRRAGAWVLRELRPYERSRWGEHNPFNKLDYLRARPTGIVMLALQALLHNASMAQI